MLTHLQCLVAVLALAVFDDRLTLTVRERDPASDAPVPALGAKVVFCETGPVLEDWNRMERRRPVLVEVDRRGQASFLSAFGYQGWNDANGVVQVFKPGYVPCLVSIPSCSLPDLELARGHAARLRLRAPPGVGLDLPLEASVQVPVHKADSMLDLGAYSVDLDWRTVAGDRASVELELTGFASESTRALMTFDGYESIEIGPWLADEVVLRPVRRHELRVCDWETGAPIEGVRAVLRYGSIDAGGGFVPGRRKYFEYHRIWSARDAALEELTSNPKSLRSDVLLLPGETAAQVTNLVHADYSNAIYATRGGEPTHEPLTIWTRGDGETSSTLFLRRMN